MLIIGSTVGGLFVPLAYDISPFWRPVTFYFILLPCLLMLIGVFFLLEDTPQALIKTSSAEEICQALNRIGRINGVTDQVLSEEV